jgi:acetyltransferase-like isoleucine patch superfamily enzyme
MLIQKTRLPIKQMLLLGWLPSGLKKMAYRGMGYRVGKGVHLSLGSLIIGRTVEIGDFTEVGFFSIVRARSIKIGRHVSIGATTMIDTERVEIGDDSKINEQVFVGGPVDPESYIKIGKRTIIMQMSFLNPTKPLIIGDDTGIGGHCLLFTHGSWLSQIDGYPVTFAPITLGKNVWLPWRVFILPGVTVGDNVVIGANSLVTKSLPSNTLAAGSPAKIIAENYPPALSEEKRTAILTNIFDEFQKYLEYFQYKVTKNRLDAGTELSMTGERGTFRLVYLPEKNANARNAANCDLLVIDYAEDATEATSLGTAAMKVNLRQKHRIGSSDAGEEFVHYISRYGVRFERLD